MRHKLINATAFFAIGAVLFWLVQAIVIPKNLETTASVINGFKALDEDTVDAVFVGPSNILCGIAPMKIYEDTNLKTYSLGTSGQPVELSYGLLEVAFRSQRPKVVALEAGSLFYSDNEIHAETEEDLAQPNYAVPQEMNYNSYWWRVFETLPLGRDKLTIAKEYLTTPYSDDLLTVLFPMINYHTRWEWLSRVDFTPNPTGPFYAAGEDCGVEVMPAAVTVDQENWVAGILTDENVGSTVQYDGKKTETVELTDPVYEPIITERHLEYLEKIQELCVENGTELILIKIPKVGFPPKTGSAWTKIKSDIIRDLAHDLGLDFVDFVYDYDVIDFATDTKDGGAHLNGRGAEKISLVLEPILLEKIPNGGGKNAIYDQMLEDYQKIREVMYLEMETDFTAYIEKLGEKKEDWIIFIVASDDYTYAMTQADYRFLEEKLGLTMIGDGEFGDSYVAIVDQGKLTYEELSDRRITCKTDFMEREASLISSGIYHNQLASVMIDGEECAVGSRGLNIVVFDRESEQVVDSVAFDTQVPEKTATHGEVNNFFNAYETAVTAS